MKLGLVIFGDLTYVSGGFLYDRQLKAGLEARGHTVEILSLPWGSYLSQLRTGLMRFKGGFNAGALDVLIEDELCHAALLRGPSHRHSSPPPLRISLVHHLRSSERHSAVLQPLYRAVERAYLRRVDGFIYNSETTQQSVETILDRSTIGVVARPGKDHVRPAPWTGPGTEPAPQPASVRLLSVGSLTKRKGHDRLIEALEGIPDLAWELDIAGSLDTEPAYARSIQDLLARSPIGSRIHLHGELSREDLESLYREADVFVLTSHYEGYGIAYVEALGYGLPILAGIVGGAPEIVEHGRQGFLVDSNSPEHIRHHLRQLLSDGDLRESQGRAALECYRSLPSWDETTTAIDAFLLEMLQTREVLG